MKYLFLDTNIFLHYRDFEEIPWGNFEGIKDEFCLCITPTVLDELDDQKDNSKGKIQKRAKKYSSKLFDIFTDVRMSKYQILRIKECTPSEEDTRKLDIHKKDNLILLSALHSGFPTCDIIIVSSDKHMLLKATDLNLGFLQIPEDYQLHETDFASVNGKPEENSKEENPKLFLPKIAIKFFDEKSIISFSRPPIIDEAFRMKEIMDAIQLDVPKKEYVEPDNTLDYLSRIAVSPFNTKEGIERYNNDRDEYLKEELAYNHLKLQKEILDSRFKKLILEVINSGSAPSGDLVLEIEFPESVKLYTTKDSRDCLTCTTPLKPSFNIMLPRETMRTMVSFQQGYGKENFYLWNSEKHIKRHKFLIQQDTLMHNFKREISLSIYIDTFKESSFPIRWCAQAENAPTMEAGEIQVNIE